MRRLALVVLTLWLIAPMVPLAIWSLTQSWFFPDLLPAQWSLKSWRYVGSAGSGVLPSLGLTIALSGAVTALSVALGLPAARALGLYRFRGKALVELLIFAPTLVPGIAVGMGLHSVFLSLGLTNSFAGVALAHLIPTLPYTILILAGVFANFDTAYEDQARSLGASRLTVLRHITLPAILPGVITAALFAFLVSWSQYVLTLLIGGGRIVTLPLLLFNFTAAGRNDIAGAIAMIYILPGVLILMITARHLTGRNAAIALGKP